MRFLSHVILITLILVLFNCNKKTQPVVQSDQILIQLSKTPCYGKCPVYKLMIYQDGRVSLEGRKNMDMIGNFKLKISDEQVQQLINDFNESGFFDLEDEYLSKKTDLSTTYITFNYQGKSKKIRDYDNAPKKLKELEKKVESLLKRSEWLEDK